MKEKVDDLVVYREVHQDNGKVVAFVSGDRALLGGRVEETHEKNHFTRSTLSTYFRRVFLPEGYPASVSEDYWDYQTWDTLQAFASSVSGSLATQAVLRGVGVGDQTATPLAATITWLLRHGAGMIGQIVFTFAKGSDLDHNCKRWRMFADVLNDAAMLVELSAPMWPRWCVQPLLCSAGVFRSLVGVAGGATRAAITQHQARANNISDVAAKDSSQETLVNLSALVANLLILPLLAEDPFLTWSLFALMVVFHLYANFRAVKSLRFATLNRQRLLFVLREMFAEGRTSPPPGIEEANVSESVIVGFGMNEKSALGRKVRLGVSFQSVVDKFGRDRRILEEIAARIGREKYLVFVHDDVVNVVLAEEVGKRQVLRAYLEACLMARKGEDHVESVDSLLESLEEVGYWTDYLQMGTEGCWGKS